MYAWYILGVKYVIIIYTFAVIKHEVLCGGVFASVAGKLFPGLPYRLERGIAKRQVQHRGAKGYSLVLANMQRRCFRAALLIL